MSSSFINDLAVQCLFWSKQVIFDSIIVVNSYFCGQQLFLNISQVIRGFHLIPRLRARSECWPPVTEKLIQLLVSRKCHFPNYLFIFPCCPQQFLDSGTQSQAHSQAQQNMQVQPVQYICMCKSTPRPIQSISHNVARTLQDHKWLP